MFFFSRIYWMEIWILFRIKNFCSFDTILCLFRILDDPFNDKLLWFLNLKISLSLDLFYLCIVEHLILLMFPWNLCADSFICSISLSHDIDFLFLRRWLSIQNLMHLCKLQFLEEEMKGIGKYTSFCSHSLKWFLKDVGSFYEDIPGKRSIKGIHYMNNWM